MISINIVMHSKSIPANWSNYRNFSIKNIFLIKLPSTFVISPTKPRSIFVLIFLQIRILSLTSLNVFVLAPQVLISSAISPFTSLRVLTIIFIEFSSVFLRPSIKTLFICSSSNFLQFVVRLHEQEQEIFQFASSKQYL